jgi:hypothetical protein
LIQPLSFDLSQLQLLRLGFSTFPLSFVVLICFMVYLTFATFHTQGADASSWGCFACKEVMEQVYDFISSNSTPTEIFNVLDKVCKVLPGKLKNSVRSLVPSPVGCCCMIYYMLVRSYGC